MKHHRSLTVSVLLPIAKRQIKTQATSSRYASGQFFSVYVLSNYYCLSRIMNQLSLLPANSTGLKLVILLNFYLLDVTHTFLEE